MYYVTRVLRGQYIYYKLDDEGLVIEELIFEDGYPTCIIYNCSSAYIPAFEDITEYPEESYDKLREFFV
jgi:hypothetical protein